MSAKKYYAVKVGKTTGVFETWEECEESVKGFPGALYKSFKEKADAYEYMGWEGKQLSFDDLANMSGSDDTPFANETKKEEMPFSNTVKAVAYVDGSFNDATGEFGCGVVMFYNGEETHMSEASADEKYVGMRNVAGEIGGSMMAMKFAIDNNVSYLTIYHDYMGISKWCTGEWKTNKVGTKEYKKYYDMAKKKVNITFEKVKGHSGDKYNDLADELAKKAVGIE